MKDLIDSIVDLLAEDEIISKLYDLWYEKKYEILRTYTSELPPKESLSQNKEFKSIKNEIIREAMRIHQENGKTTVDPPKTHQYTPTVSATAVTRLFKNLCNIFRDKIDDGMGNAPVVPVVRSVEFTFFLSEVAAENVFRHRDDLFEINRAGTASTVFGFHVILCDSAENLGEAFFGTFESDTVLNMVRRFLPPFRSYFWQSDRRDNPRSPDRRTCRY